MSSPLGKLRSRLRAGSLLLPALAVLALAGCGSPWRQVPVGSVDESTRELGEYVRLTTSDDRVIEMRVTAVVYPWVEGTRIVSGWSNGRVLRVDLRNVTAIEVRGPS